MILSIDSQVWHKPTDLAVQELRAKLQQHSGMKGLELVCKGLELFYMQ